MRAALINYWRIPDHIKCRVRKGVLRTGENNTPQ